MFERKPLIAGNWKMNNNISESIALARQLKFGVVDVVDRDILICPAFTSLRSVAETIQDSKIMLGAQNMYPEQSGAFTGEISPLMLKDIPCTHVILGHSERRHILFETNISINQKLHSALENNLIPILCVGEKLEEREQGKTEDVVRTHIVKGLEGVSVDIADKVVIAYEPVWAIGTGKTATKDQAEEVHRFIRKILTEIFNETIAQSIRILYGGSVKPDNVDDLMAQPDIDGVLVGGASLTSEKFLRIIKFETKQV